MAAVRAGAEQGFHDVAEVVAHPATLRVYEHGWQSFSPTGVYPATATSPRPATALSQVMGYRPETPAPAAGFQGEGLLAVVGPDGDTTLCAAADPVRSVASLRVRVERDRVVVSADGPVDVVTTTVGLASTLEQWADGLAARMEVGPLRALPAGWCSWYCYWSAVTEQDIVDNLLAIDRLGLDIGVVQVDDGHQAEIGDWLDRSPRFGPLAPLAARVTATGRQAGIWTAPYLVGARSRLAAQHPDWLLRGDDGPVVVSEDSWGQRILALDITRAGAAEHLATVYRTLAADGFTYYKLDFLLAGALLGHRAQDASPVEVYREGLRIVREAVGPAAVLLGCGAPMLPSVGLVDAMRVSPDVGVHVEPELGDLSQPGVRSAMAAGRARAWQQGRFWVNDPDCLLARPEMPDRDGWAEHVEATGGLVVSSDPLAALDRHGLELTRRLLRPADPGTTTWEP